MVPGTQEALTITTLYTKLCCRGYTIEINFTSTHLGLFTFLFQNLMWLLCPPNEAQRPQPGVVLWLTSPPRAPVVPALCFPSHTRVGAQSSLLEPHIASSRFQIKIPNHMVGILSERRPLARGHLWNPFGESIVAWGLKNTTEVS
jgi:hypothetical protein